MNLATKFFYKTLFNLYHLRTLLFTFKKIPYIWHLFICFDKPHLQLFIKYFVFRDFWEPFYSLSIKYSVFRDFWEPFPPTFWKRLCYCIFLGIVHCPPSTELCTGAFGSVASPPPASLYGFCEIYTYREIGDISGNG